ncbi:MAG: hexapeptide transferase [Bacteroidales bacterium]|nr:hexapeptide transferase [Bacteroidales bacterium]
MNKDIIIVGAYHEIIELCEACKFNIIGLIDNSLKGNLRKYPILGSDDDAKEIYLQYPNVPVIICPDKPSLRKKLVLHYQSIGFSFTNLISPKSNISSSSILGKGIVIQSLTNISSETKIGDFVKINSMANVMHDCMIDDFTTIAPNAVILGRVNIDNMCYIGANSTILPNIHVGKNSVVGAGAVVVKNVSPNSIVIGNPAKYLRNNDI